MGHHSHPSHCFATGQCGRWSPAWKPDLEARMMQLPMWHCDQTDCDFCPTLILNYLCNGHLGYNYFNTLNCVRAQAQALKFTVSRRQLIVSQTIPSHSLGSSTGQAQFPTGSLDMIPCFGFWGYRRGQTVLIVVWVREFTLIPFNFVGIDVASVCYAPALTIQQYVFLQ